MRIDGFNAATQIATEQNAQVSSHVSARSGLQDSDDRTTLSVDSASISSLATKALESPSLRQDKIDSLRQAITSGQYKLDPSKIAGSMIDEEA
jgi:negative regulator of flagellin synthesis FlgM